MKKDYSRYEIAWWEKLALLAVSALVMLVLSWLFYDFLYGIVLTPVLYVLAKRFWAGYCRKRQQEKLVREFLDAIRSIGTALLAGYSMENAWREAQKEMLLLYGKQGLMYQELQEMNRGVEMNVPLENLLLEFAHRSGSEDILEFAQIFQFAKRSGGDFAAIISSTAGRISGKFETEQEIAVTVASRQMEQKVMDVIPLGILAYMKLCSGDYMAILYGNPLGIGFMTLCLIVYGLALWLSARVLDIHV